MSNSSSLVIVTPASASVEMFSSISPGVIVKRPFVLVSSVRISSVLRLGLEGLLGLVELLVLAVDVGRRGWAPVPGRLRCPSSP